MELIGTPIILSAVIGGSIAVVTLLTNLYLSLSKHKYHEITSYQNLVIDKLEKIYSPLLNKIKINIKKQVLIDDSIQILVEKYGYLLSDELFEDISSLRRIEDLDKLQKPFNTSKIERDNLRRKIYDSLKREFKELKGYHEKSFNRYTKKLNKTLLVSTLDKIVLICYLITISFYLFLIARLIIADITPELVFFENSIINTFFVIFMIIIIITTLSGIGAIIGNLVDFITKIRGKKKKMFTVYDYVPESGEYICRICGSTQMKYQYSRFDNCEKHSFTKNLKILYLYFNWKKKSIQFYNELDQEA
ncbi:hypothetical protein [Bacillus horti]|uniref:hypothetical protein n=1 Tax=Caldalkalibacillus horti TaxID=77523 RepID=UPI0027D7DBA6|nr:hypothetical protein [Bacillus horti]